jgi:hypothetical protein
MSHVCQHAAELLITLIRLGSGFLAPQQNPQQTSTKSHTVTVGRVVGVLYAGWSHVQQRMLGSLPERRCGAPGAVRGAATDAADTS